ncbi:large subunit ribosomal protein L25 [Abditibacterium utsteinense]|uniref:Large ribosomal subunit protein bL25 n=1 Tax=Abditibacterium utsteinense TaxID=1960156 RepID=A0A2S8SR26_9BACT|nr:50S ribosomal protein L25 [Abditibacterium utsteinense]PQV63235.1 large subunit ribosomal protein L25 [Abditibacterium utsteinense]
MSQKELSTESRELRGKVAARQMRRAGKLPAVLYGHGQDPISLSVNAKEFSDLIAHSGTHMLLNLKGASTETAVIKKIERHPVKGIPATIDFLRVAANERITTKVTLLLENEPLDVKSGAGLLVQSLHEIEISALPAEMPEHISVDISHLVLNGPAVHISEIPTIAGIDFLTHGEEAIAAINTPKKVDLDAPMDEADAEIEAEGQHKAEEAAASNVENATVAEDVTAEAAQEVPAEHGASNKSGGEGLKQETHTGNKSE